MGRTFIWNLMRLCYSENSKKCFFKEQWTGFLLSSTLIHYTYLLPEANSQEILKTDSIGMNSVTCSILLINIFDSTRLHSRSTNEVAQSDVRQQGTQAHRVTHIYSCSIDISMVFIIVKHIYEYFIFSCKNSNILFITLVC